MFGRIAQAAIKAKPFKAAARGLRRAKPAACRVGGVVAGVSVFSAVSGAAPEAAVSEAAAANDAKDTKPKKVDLDELRKLGKKDLDSLLDVLDDPEVMKSVVQTMLLHPEKFEDLEFMNKEGAVDPNKVAKELYQWADDDSDHENSAWDWVKWVLGSGGGPGDPENFGHAAQVTAHPDCIDGTRIEFSVPLTQIPGGRQTMLQNTIQLGGGGQGPSGQPGPESSNTMALVYVNGPAQLTGMVTSGGDVVGRAFLGNKLTPLEAKLTLQTGAGQLMTMMELVNNAENRFVSLKRIANGMATQYALTYAHQVRPDLVLGSSISLGDQTALAYSAKWNITPFDMLVVNTMGDLPFKPDMYTVQYYYAPYATYQFGAELGPDHQTGSYVASFGMKMTMLMHELHWGFNTAGKMAMTFASASHGLPRVTLTAENTWFADYKVGFGVQLG